VTKFQAYNTPAAKAKSETNRDSVGQQIQTICLDSSPDSADKTSSSFNSTLPAISLSHLRPYKWEAELDRANNASPSPPFAQQVKQEPPPPHHYHQYQPPPIASHNVRQAAPTYQQYQPSPLPHQFQPPPLPLPQATSTQQQHSQPYVPDYNALMDVAAKKPNSTGLARECFEIIFEQEIRCGLFQHGQYNLYGRTMRGSNDR
jgi:hypothetical protein